MVLPDHNKARSSHIAFLNMTNPISGWERQDPVIRGGLTYYSILKLFATLSDPSHGYVLPRLSVDI